LERFKGKRALITGGTSGIGLENRASERRPDCPLRCERCCGSNFLIQALLPVFANPASIILNTSVNAHIGMPNTSVYGATKAALLSLARTLSGELISRGIRVNAVSPGPISTPLYNKLGLSQDDLRSVAASIESQVLAGRFGKPSEIALTVPSWIRAGSLWGRQFCLQARFAARRSGLEAGLQPMAQFVTDPKAAKEPQFAL